MSEYKYACPVCGQHMRCDSSQAGTVMECPTCFQKITAPQAPAPGDDQKFVLTGTKVGERPVPKVAEPRPGVVPVEKNFPIWIVLVIVALLAAGGGIYFFKAKSSGGKPSGGKPAHPALASAWQSGDIGDVGAAGSFTEAKGVLTISGSGADIWHQADGFHYVFQALDGDGALTARVLNLKNTDEWAKAGVMIREKADAGSMFALASIRSDGQAQFLWRSGAGRDAESSDLAGGTGYPKWVKVVRSGNSFSAYYKVNAGDAWQQVGASQTISMSPGAKAGLIVCAHHAGTLCQAQFGNMALESDRKAGPVAAAHPPVIAPPASDTNWLLSLGTNAIPNSPVAGRIHGQDFIVERASFVNGALMLCAGTRGPVEFGAFINFGGAQAESLSGQTINVTTNADKAAKVTLRWKDADGTVQKENFDDSYALRLEFGALANNRLPGKIYLCTPDAEKSYLLGTFNADARKPKPPKK